MIIEENESKRIFAPGYERNQEGWIIFPEDRIFRQDVFDVKVEHPSKNNMFMLQEIVRYTCSGRTRPVIICDPMAGAGSTMITAEEVDEVVLIELEPHFAGLLEQNADAFGDNITVYNDNCLNVLPSMSNQFDLVMFSPPYSNQIKQNSGMAQYREGESGSARSIVNYTSHKDNLSLLADFPFNMQMNKVYRLCGEALKPGGWLVVVIKDQIRAGARVDFGAITVRAVLKATSGKVVPVEWYRHTHLGKLFGIWNKQHGHRVVEDEHIIMLRKEG
jgi:DNA modification methylase